MEFLVEILHNDDIEWHESFRVLLGPEDPSGASLGDRALVTVTILDDEVSGSLVFPAQPMVGFENNTEDSYPHICKIMRSTLADILKFLFYGSCQLYEIIKVWHSYIYIFAIKYKTAES